VRRQDFSYDLPEELIAQVPLAERSASRMLVLDGPTGALADRAVRDLPGLLQPGDLLVLNDTRVVAARLVGVKPSGGRVEVLLERDLAGHEALAQLAASKPIREGLEVQTAGGTVRVLGREAELWRIALPAPALEFFERWGEVPLPPYIRRPADHTDRERYQSIFARAPGAVAAPTAGLHFTPDLEAALRERGIGLNRITLHVGAGTFLPVKVDDTSEHKMHSEWGTISPEVAETLNAARAKGGRVVAIGTTSLRLLESAAAENGIIQPFSDDTAIFITPGYRFRAVDILLTNFHLPRSTLFMLVSAFSGLETMKRVYAHAIENGYRFYSYGDACLLFRGQD